MPSCLICTRSCYFDVIDVMFAALGQLQLLKEAITSLQIISFMILAIISAVLTTIQVIVASAGCVNVSRRYSVSYPDVSCIIKPFISLRSIGTDNHCRLINPHGRLVTHSQYFSPLGKLSDRALVLFFLLFN